MAKLNTHRLIKVPIQLVVQSQKYKFVSANFLRDDFGNLSKKRYGGLAIIWDVDESGFIHREDDMDNLPLDQKQKELVKKYFKKSKKIQQVVSYFINPAGLYIDEYDLQAFPDRLYEKFALLESDKELSKFIRQYNFCDFFDANAVMLKRENDPYLEHFVPTEKKPIVRLNWLGIYRKHSDFSDIAKRFWKKETQPKDLLYLESELSINTRKIYFDSKSYKRLNAVDPEMDFEDNFLDIFQPKKFGKDYVQGYQVFGHYTYCCLELYTEIKKKMPEQRFCENEKCGKPLPLFAHSSQKTCKNNPECHRQWRAQSKKIERQNKKRRKREK
jgi:hypothetical protein